MNFVRTHRSLIAWMLYGFVLFNGVACGFGHGQMLSAISSISADDICGDTGAVSPSMDKGSHALVMQLAAFDCAFAGKLTVALLFFIGLGWLARTLNVRRRLPQGLLHQAPRHSSPGCLPQAP
ncbi:DUF2946 domain-containing protein [Pseudomonas alliivorans]|uniref:DUF2946 domain-containing protein n=1 Tax=Pseudomonas alliivorans TaxID=2810613 RepID=A0ABS4CC02_9PSED|nr:DUF2946 domain-containing protein [Pseudomonas alliivorans]MBP0942499.1 DUF2946 domain-containing protein [Pseudomonas alliivorans]MBP0948217.1 DUF2946 domain-containing protein [Pseudomonas alliivorans]MBP0949509.1 DUF2946 domain-containing protein [Pseudomonas alliivorans]MEE4325017.1 DUF2946 domain-containing protein [Pseudomonas alliivorans]MEE4366547.1 DUF2946 domain-containing protein [Pseudomonas alliivorans]